MAKKIMSQDEAVKAAVKIVKAGGLKVTPFAHQPNGVEHSIYMPDVEITPANICGNIGLDDGGNVVITLSCKG